MKRYKAIVEGVEKFFNVTPDRYDDFIAKYPDAVLVEGPETEEDSKADTEILSTIGNPGFQKDTAESADVVSEDVAQNDMDLLSANGSLELQNQTESFSIDNKKVTKEEFDAYSKAQKEKNLTGEEDQTSPLYIEDVIERNNISEEIKSIDNSLQDFSFSATDKGIEAIERRNYLQTQLDLTVNNKLFSIYEMPEGEDKNNATLSLSKDQQKTLDAVEEIAKDTGAKSATDKDTVFKKFDAVIDPITGLLKDLGRVEEVPTETYKYTEEVFDIVATKVSNDNTTKGRANFNALDFSAKEKIITESRAKAFDNITKRNKNVAEDLMKQDVELQQELVNYTNKLIDENSVIKGNTPDDKFTQAQVEAFNINVGLINQAVKEYNIKQENLKKEFKNIQNSQDTLAGTYKISEATGKIKDTFKKTQEIRDFKKEASAGLDGYAQGINSLTQGVTQIFLEGSIGWTSFLLGKTASIFQDVLSGDSSYNQFDAFVDIIDNNIAYDVLGVEASKAFTPGRDNTGADFAALAGDIIPFSFYLITQAKKGNISGIENAIGKISRRKPVKDVLSGADKDMITAAATVRALALGNYTDALDQGLSKSDAFAYSSALTIGTMGVQMIMPDYKFLNGKNVTNALAKLPFKNKGLGTNAAAKAGYEASKQFVGGMAKEFGEEEMEVGFQRLLNTSFALANSEFFSDEWWKEQKQLVAGVGMLSSGLGSVGSYKTATDVYAETIRTNQNKIKNLKFELFTTKTKLEEAKANGVNIPQQSIDEVQASIDYATRLDVAITQSPNNVTGQELAMLVEKNTLLDEKKNLDKAYHGPINKRISEIDQEIAESRSTTFIKGALEKDIKFSEELSKDLDLKGEIKTFNNEEELNSFQESIKDDIDGVAESTTGYGTIINLKDGSDVILINKGKAFAQGRINTTAHELLHRYLRKLLKGNEYDIKTVGKELSSYYDSLGLKSDLEFESRRLQYEKKYGINSVEYNEEVITLLSEAMLDKKVKETEGKISKLISAVKGLFSLSVEEGSIELNDGKSVFNFVKEFNKSVKAGKASKNLKAGTQGATGSLIKAEGPSTTNTSKQSLDLNTGAQQELDAALQALEEAEAVLDEDFDNPQSQKAVDEAEAAFNAVVQKQANQAAGIEEESAEEVVSEEINEVAAKDFVKTKKDPSTKKRSLTPEVKSVIEKKIVKAKTETDKLVKKQKAAIDKKLKEIDALPSSEMERTPKAALKKLAKNNPVEFAKQQGIEVPKPAGLAILEKEISEDLKVPIEKFVKSVGVLFYKLQKPQVRDTVDLNTFLDVVRGDVLNMTIREFKKNTINRQGEAVVNDIEDIIFSRGGRRIIDVSKRLIVGQEKTNSTKEIKSEQVKDVKKIKPSSILAGTKNRYNRAKDKVKEFWAKNKDNEKVRTFKGLKSVIDEVTAEIFGVSPSALSARSGNLNKPSMDNALKNITEPLNVVEIRNANGDIETARVNKEEINEYINDLNRRKLLEKSDPEYIEGYTRSKETTSILDLLTKFFPKSTVPEYFYADGDRGDKLIIEKDTGIGNKLKEALYVTKERGGLGSGNTLRDLSDVTFDDMLDVIGAYKDTDGVFKFKDGVNGRSPEGLRLLELVKLTGKYITNELSRTEAGLDPMTIADIGAGKNAQMFSNELPSNFFSNDKFKDWRTASNISIGDDTIDELAKLHKKKRMSLLDVGNALMEKFKLYDDIQVGRKFRAEFVKILEKEYPNMSTKIAQLKALKDLSYAFGEEFKYITQEIAFNNEWSKIENIKENKLSKEEKVETINNFIKRWSRATRNLKLLGVTRNDQLFKKIGEASGLGKKGLNDLLFTTGKEDNLSYIRYNGINLYGFRSTDSIKKSIQKGGADRAAAVVRVNTDARLARETMYEVIDEFIANEDFRGAYAALALAREDMNGLLRKVSSFGKYIVLDEDNKLIMEHETDVQSIYEEYIKYIDQKGSESAKNKLDGFLDKAYVNLVSADLNALLDKNGGPNRYNNNKVKSYIKEAKKKGIYEDYLTENVELAKSIQKFLPKILRNNSATLNESLKQAEDYNKALLIANSLNIPSKGISVWDFDDTLAQTKSNVLYTMPDGSKGKLNAEQFAKDGDRLMAEGAVYDFSEFSKVVQGSKGPFFEKAMARNKKFGNKNVFILTARPANSATAIHEFLKGIGLNIPLDNITGLANSSPQAKANWVVSKAAKGYNDFYFADDAAQNVKAVDKALKKLPVKSKAELAIIKKSAALFSMDTEYTTKWAGLRDLPGNERARDLVTSGTLRVGKNTIGITIDDGASPGSEALDFDFPTLGTIEIGFDINTYDVDAKLSPKDKFKIFGAVINAVTAKVKSYGDEVSAITFSGLGRSRSSLYTLMAQRYAAELGWKMKSAVRMTTDFATKEMQGNYVIYRPKVELAGPSDNTYSLKKQPKAVQDVLKTIDIKSQVQQARVRNSLELNQQFNMFLEKSTGIESFKKYKSDKAKLKGRFKGKLDVFIPPSAEDFLGLLYQTLNKGKLGDAQIKFYEDNLLKPYAKANSALRSARVRSIREFDAIKKKLKIVPKDLKKSFKFEDENGNMKDSLFSKEQAIRVYIWNAQGIEMPNLSQVDLAVMVNHVNAEPELKAFADELLKLNRGMKSKAPSKNWMDGNIGIDLQANLNSVGRKKLLEVWQQNVDAIFSEENLNKLEAAYGPEYVKALKNSLRRMRTGRSAVPVTDNEAGNNLITWLNSAVGNIMFFNNRSALLQMLSATNFLNFEENNIIAAGKALMDIKQYSKDFMTLMNSDYLVDRRDGTRINVNEADIALIAKQSGIAGVISKILEKGFLPTKYADSLAIGIGGATFYRTKINALMKEGMSKAKAEAQAMQEFISVAETSQQSSDQSKISMEQAGSVGKIILAFNNTSSQYSRIIKRSVQDLYNRRGSDKANLARIVYYGGMQNLLFNFMQQAMFAAMWGGEDDEEVLDGKKAKIVNSMADGLLRGMGVKAAIFVAMKNTAIKLYERSKKDVNKDYRYYAVMGLLALSPPLSSKASKISKAASAFQYGEDKMKYGKFGLDSPKLEIGANLVSFATSLPTDRLLRKAINVSDALDASNEPWERLFMAMGWPKWTMQSKAESDLERKEDKAEIKEAKEKAEFEAMTPLEQKTKALEDLKKFQQVDSLKAYGLTDKEIRLLTKEEDRVNKILSLEGSEKKGLTPADKAEEELYDLKKKQQVDSLTKYGLTKKQIRDLKYEEDRVNEILRLRKKNKKIKDTLK